MDGHEWSNLSISSIPSECTERWGYPWGSNSGKNPHISDARNSEMSNGYHKHPELVALLWFFLPFLPRPK